MLCFALEYANLGRWLTRRTLTLLAIPILIQLLLVLTNDAHHWIWASFPLAEYIQPVYGIGSLALIGYGYLLVLLNIITLLWLFVRSPLHRWPVALMLLCRLATATAFLLGVVNRNPFAPMDPTVLTVAFTSGLWAFALFYFRMFDPIPIARKTVIEQMQEGMLVLDTTQKIVDLNPAAEKLLGLPASRVRGRNVAEVLPAYAEMSTRSGGGETGRFEISLGIGAAVHSYTLHPSPLKDRNGQTLGYLFLFRDVTEEKRAQAKLLEQGRAIAALEERQRLARDLHDGLGQVLGYAGFQAEAARKLMNDGQAAAAAEQLARLSAITRDAQADVREFILNLRLGPSPQQPFFPALRQYLENFSMQYAIQTGLTIGDGLDERDFELDARLHIFRIIQEALSNARKHSGARSVQVAFECEDHRARVTVQDDGRGFDAGQSTVRRGVGLDFMRERVELLGGCLRIQSEPGAGTRVIVEVPLK